MSRAFASVTSWSTAAGRYTSHATTSGRWPSFFSRFASFEMLVVFPDPCRPTSMITVGGREAVSSFGASPPRISTSSPCTMSMTCCAGLRLRSTCAPSAFSFTRVVNSRTTLKFTSASSIAIRTSRSAWSRSSSVTIPREPNFRKAPCSLSVNESNIALQCSDAVSQQRYGRLPDPRFGRRVPNHAGRFKLRYLFRAHPEQSAQDLPVVFPEQRGVTPGRGTSLHELPRTPRLLPPVHPRVGQFHPVTPLFQVPVLLDRLCVPPPSH